MRMGNGRALREWETKTNGSAKKLDSNIDVIRERLFWLKENKIPLNTLKVLIERRFKDKGLQKRVWRNLFLDILSCKTLVILC